MILVGTQTNNPSKPVSIDLDGLLHHTIVVGQSGSGKSFFVARLLEEIVLNTGARIVLVDPNGDFKSFNQPSTSVWTRMPHLFTEISKAGDRGEDYDVQDKFSQTWSERRFLQMHPKTARLPPDSQTVLHRPLHLHWDNLEEDDRDFLLRLGGDVSPRILTGLEACLKNAKHYANLEGSRFGYDIRGLINSAEQFALQHLSMKEYAFAKNLNVDDWYAVRTRFNDLRQRHSVWASQEGAKAPPPGLAHYLDGPFDGVPATSEANWDVLSIALDAAREADSLLIMNTTLSRLWKKAKEVWRSPHAGAVPTFIVVDEAQNFAPRNTSDPLRERVTRRLIQIAAEGRKYGLYLLLATQRPTKLHPELVPECENSCVLRVQSSLDINFLEDALGVEPRKAAVAPTYQRGQGLLSGRWTTSEVGVDARFAPARTTVGGGGLTDEWMTRKSGSAPFELLPSIKELVETTLKESAAPVRLVDLAATVRTEFPEAEQDEWSGYGSFKNMVDALGIADLSFHSAPPGYAYLEGRHDPPVTPPSSSGRPKDASPELREALALLHREKNLPLLEKQEFRRVIIGISDYVRENEFNLTDASKSVRDELGREGMTVARLAVSFVIKGISMSGHDFSSDLAQDPGVLAKAFEKSLEWAMDGATIGTLEATLYQGVIDHCTGGLLDGLEGGELPIDGSPTPPIPDQHNYGSSAPPLSGQGMPNDA